MPVESLRVSGRSAVEVTGDDESNGEQLMRSVGLAALYVCAGRGVLTRADAMFPCEFAGG
jgi:hypothetical protein